MGYILEAESDTVIAVSPIRLDANCCAGCLAVDAARRIGRRLALSRLALRKRTLLLRKAGVIRVRKSSRERIHGSISRGDGAIRNPLLELHGGRTVFRTAQSQHSIQMSSRKQSEEATIRGSITGQRSAETSFKLDCEELGLCWPGDFGARLGPADPAQIATSEQEFHRYATLLNGHPKGRKRIIGDDLAIADFSIGASMAMAQPFQYPLANYAAIPMVRRARIAAAVEQIDCPAFTCPAFTRVMRKFVIRITV
jgi:hypothetical protein